MMHRALVMILALASCAHMTAPVTLPPEIAAALPPTCRQVLYVTATDDKATTAELHLLRREAAAAWIVASETILVRIGRSGLAWGLGEPALPAPSGFRDKQEGDNCAPAGIFRIPVAFGSDAPPQGLRLPYIRCTGHHFGIDDPGSRFYNRIVDEREVTCDWSNPETMIPSSGCYKIGAVIAHNPQHRPGLGSCIFLHIWQGKDIPTSGCTAMSDSDLRAVLAWLDPAADPRLVQIVKPH
jgi:L,D-peptidoglycan transpeptidase YkuD (ErfK/YbiS/YcfS/YnhG family)